MFLHLRVPAFHAAVHQAIAPILRGKPVCVALDASEASPLIAASLEARSQAVWAGMRADHAKRRCPGIAVVVQEPERYEAAHRCLLETCAHWTPQVDGISGRCDLDLAGTDMLWRQRLPGAAGDPPHLLAERIALALRQRCEEGLRLPAVIGGSARLVFARLAAALARDTDLCPSGVHILAPGGEDAVDALPVRRLDGCPPAVRVLLERCGIATIGALRALTARDLVAITGTAGEELHRLLHGEADPVAPQADPEPAVSVAAHAEPGGAGTAAACAMVRALAREVGWKLRQRQSACGRLTLTARWLDGRQAQASTIGSAEGNHDDDLAGSAVRLLERLDTRRVMWDRLRLVASALCPVQDQARLFGPARACRLEAARDRLRARFGLDVVRPAAAPSDLICDA
jgi:nucleotidyltransferase/DNA polymerase involved in DNA repair